MSVRVIIKDVKKRTKACDECKRRKGRCDGGMPCEWCSARNLECVFSAFSQKRGPKKKRKGNESENEEEQEILTLDKREQGLSYDLELSSYLDIFLKYMDPLFTMFPQWEKAPSRMSMLSHPRSYAQFITKYAACAIAARASGQKERATQLITEARSFAGQCFDDMSSDGLLGFIMLAAYWVGTDTRMTKHYANIALSIYSTLPPDSLPPNMQYILAVCAVVLNNAISESDKVRVFMATTDAIVAQTHGQMLLGAVMRLCMKAFAHMKCIEASLLRTDITAVLLCQVVFSEKQRQGMLAELRYCKSLSKLCVHEHGGEVAHLVSTMLMSLEVFIEWRSGHSELALPLAIEYANARTGDESIKLGNRFDVEHLLYVSIFLREQQHPALADKLRKTADALHSYVCEALPELSSSADSLSSYLRRKPVQSDALVAFRAPPPPPPMINDPYNHIDDTAVPVMVNNVLSLVAQLLPSNNPKALLSAQGLHLFYNTLSSIVPPAHSPYEYPDDPPVSDQNMSTGSGSPPTLWNDSNNQSTYSSPNSSPGIPSPSSPDNLHTYTSSPSSPSTVPHACAQNVQHQQQAQRPPVQPQHAVQRIQQTQQMQQQPQQIQQQQPQQMQQQQQQLQIQQQPQQMQQQPQQMQQQQLQHQQLHQQQQIQQLQHQQIHHPQQIQQPQQIHHPQQMQQMQQPQHLQQMQQPQLQQMQQHQLQQQFQQQIHQPQQIQQMQHPQQMQQIQPPQMQQMQQPQQQQTHVHQLRQSQQMQQQIQQIQQPQQVQQQIQQPQQIQQQIQQPQQIQQQPIQQIQQQKHPIQSIQQIQQIQQTQHSLQKLTFNSSPFSLPPHSFSPSSSSSHFSSASPVPSPPSSSSSPSPSPPSAYYVVPSPSPPLSSSPPSSSPLSSHSPPTMTQHKSTASFLPDSSSSLYLLDAVSVIPSDIPRFNVSQEIVGEWTWLDDWNKSNAQPI